MSPAAAGPATDEPLVKRARFNLLDNATRFAARASTVQIRIAADDAEPGAVALVLRNQGQGIDGPQLSRLFDGFFRGEQSRCCEGQQHYGLGLAIVAAIARMHGGRTTVRPHDGTTEIGFTVAG